MIGNPFKAPDDEAFGQIGNAKPSYPDSLFVKSRGRGLGGGSRKAQKEEQQDEPEAEPLNIQASEGIAEDEAIVASTVKLFEHAWNPERGVFNEKATASAKAELPPDKEHLTRVNFTLYALSPGGKERIDSKDTHLKSGNAEVEFILYYPQQREGNNLPSKCEYVFTVKHRDSDETVSPILEVACRELTLKDIREILEAVEKETSYQAAKLLACALNYDQLCSLAEQGGEGNNPNQMPTRFLLLPGMSDEKLEKVDGHPDDKDHAINIANLRKGLNALGYACDAAGPFDGELLSALKRYLTGKNQVTLTPKKHSIKKGETLGGIALEHGLPGWEILYSVNEKRIGASPHKLREGIELDIPVAGIEEGKRKIRARGQTPEKYLGKSGFRYPWSLLSVDLGGIGGESAQPLDILLSDKKTGASLWSGEARGIRVLLPDSQDLNIGIKGHPLDIGGIKHIHPEDEHPAPI